MRICRAILTSVCLALLVVIGTWAADGRDFSGLFETKNPVESGTDVILTFEVEVGNHCGEDVLGATVKLAGAVDLITEYATWTLVDITAGGTVELSADITIPSEEHDAWHRGAAPMLTIEFQDSAGNDRQHMVELAPMILEEVRA